MFLTQLTDLKDSCVVKLFYVMTWPATWYILLFWRGFFHLILSFYFLASVYIKITKCEGDGIRIYQIYETHHPIFLFFVSSFCPSWNEIIMHALPPTCFSFMSCNESPFNYYLLFSFFYAYTFKIDKRYTQTIHYKKKEKKNSHWKLN